MQEAPKLVVIPTLDEVGTLDGRNLLFENVRFTLSEKILNVNVEGDKSQNIIFKGVDINFEKVEYVRTSPL